MQLIDESRQDFLWSNFHCLSNSLTKIWKTFFPGQLSIEFSLDRCPMLIGVMKSFPIQNDSFSEFLFQVLNVNQEFNIEDLFYELILFKEEFDQNEQYFVSLNLRESHGSSLRILLVLVFRSKDSFLPGISSHDQWISLIKWRCFDILCWRSSPSLEL